MINANPSAMYGVRFMYGRWYYVLPGTRYHQGALVSGGVQGPFKDKEAAEAARLIHEGAYK